MKNTFKLFMVIFSFVFSFCFFATPIDAADETEDVKESIQEWISNKNSTSTAKPTEHYDQGCIDCRLRITPTDKLEEVAEVCFGYKLAYKEETENTLTFLFVEKNELEESGFTEPCYPMIMKNPKNYFAKFAIVTREISPEATAKPTVSPEKVKEILNNTITEKIGEVARKFGYVVVTEQEGSEVYFYFENNEFAKVRTSDTNYYFGIIGPECWHTVFKDYYAVSVEDVMNYVRKSSRKDVFVIERTDKLTQKEVEDYEYYTNRQKKYVIQNDEEDDDDVDVEAVKVDVQNIDAKNISSTEPTVTISIADLETSDTEAKNIANQQPKVTVQTKAATATTTSKATVKSKPVKKSSVTKKTVKTKKIKSKKTKNKKIKTKKSKTKKIKSSKKK